MSSKVRGPVFSEVVASAVMAGSVSAVFFGRGAVGIEGGFADLVGTTVFTGIAIVAGAAGVAGTEGVAGVATTIGATSMTASDVVEVVIVDVAVVVAAVVLAVRAISFTAIAGVFIVGALDVLEAWGSVFGRPVVAIGSAECTKAATAKTRDTSARPA